MKRDELYDILLKVFGFTVAVRAILACPQYLITYGAYIFQDSSSMGSYMGWQVAAMLIGTAFQVIGGFAIVVKSSSITQWLIDLGGKRNQSAEHLPGGDA